MHCIEDRSKQKDRVHLNQFIVVLQGWSYLSVRREASLLQKVLASLLSPPLAEKTRGVKEACSTSMILCSYALFFSCSCFLKHFSIDLFLLEEAKEHRYSKLQCSRSHSCSNFCFPFGGIGYRRSLYARLRSVYVIMLAQFFLKFAPKLENFQAYYTVNSVTILTRKLWQNSIYPL